MVLKKIKILFLGFLLISFSLLADKPVTLELKKIVEVGDNDFMFYSIDSVCEDDDANFYVLDRKAYKVHKFSPEGKRLLSFGNKGQGPGDFAYPHYICVTEDKKLVVCEDMAFVSLFDLEGKFLKRIRLANGLELRYISSNLYYAWIWKKKSKQQVLLDNKGKIIKSFFEVSKDAFSVGAPDETGRMVMINFFTDEYTPALLVSSYKQQAALGMGNRYEILIINHNGEVTATGKRDVEPAKIQAKEIDYFKNEINSRGNLHDSSKKKFIKKIPNYKNYFDKILVSGKYVFVFRIKEDITDEKTLIPVDIFTLQGKFLGTAKIKNQPIFISDKYAYFSETVDENLLLVKYVIRVTV